jgi:predicted RNase H-like HicB family nuclease
MQTGRNLFYYAKVEKVETDWLVNFPDLPHITAGGKSFWHAIACAEAALNAALEADSERRNSLPAPSDFHGSMGYFPIQVKTRVLQAYARRGGTKA